MVSKMLSFVVLFFASSVVASDVVHGSDSAFKTYDVPVSVDSNGSGSVQKFKLPSKETDRFLSMFMEASERVLTCDTYKATAQNPLTRRSFTIEIEKKPSGCSLDMHEYNVWVYRCFITTEQARSLSVIWKKSSHGAALGARGQDESLLLNEACDRDSAVAS